MADVVVSVRAFGHADVEFGIGGNTELAASARCNPGIRTVEFVVAAAGHTFHDFGRTGVEGQRGGQNDAYRFFGAVSQCDAVAHTFTAKVDIGGSGHSDVGNVGGDGHGRIWKGRRRVGRSWQRSPQF